MTTHEIDRELDRIARRQHGVFHRRQAVGAGLTPRMIERRRASEAWITLAPSVYALASHPPTWLRQAKAAELSVRDAAVSHRAAAFLHGFEGARAGRIDVMASPSSRHESPLATVHRSSGFEVVRRQGIRVTGVARTVSDLAGVLDPWSLERTIDGLLVARGATLEELVAEAAYANARRLCGSGTLQCLLDERGDGYVPPTNELEAVLYRILDDPRLPPYERQAPLPWWPAAPQRVDALIACWRLIVEADGRRWHTRLADFERDAARDHLAKRHGYDVLRLTHRQLCRSDGYASRLLLAIGDQHLAA
jgi:very-short-patch-repair endonuclease